MGSVYLLGTIDGFKKEIIRYEGGYIRNIFGTLIGRYDDKCVYEGTSILNTNFIGRMEFNYGYLRSSNEIFVIAHKDCSLSVGLNKNVACFDGDEKGAIAAFIFAFSKGMINIPKSDSNSTSTPISSNSSSGCGINFNQSSVFEQDETGDGANGWLAVIAIIILAIAALYSSFINWADIITTPLSKKSIEENWMAILPIISVAVGIYNARGQKKLLDIAAKFITPFLVTIVIGAICVAIYTGKVIIGFLLGIIGGLLSSIAPFIVGLLLTYIVKKII